MQPPPSDHDPATCGLAEVFQPPRRWYQNYLGEDHDAHEADTHQRRDEYRGEELLGAAEKAAAKLSMARPSPSGMLAGSSPTMAPMIEAVAAIFKAGNRYGRAAGTWSFHSTWFGVAA